MEWTRPLPTRSRSNPTSTRALKASSAMKRFLPQALLVLLLGPLASAKQPNILFCISDDQSYAHTGANGDPVIKTPAFDRVAREGIRFTHAFCDAPTCGPSRSAILTGQHIWRLEEAGNIHSTCPRNLLPTPRSWPSPGIRLVLQGKHGVPGVSLPVGVHLIPQVWNFRKES